MRAVLGGALVAETTRAWRVLETSHPPTGYVPREDVTPGCLRLAAGGSFCEWKGGAVSFDVVAGDHVAPRAAWSYPDPTPAFAPIRDAVAFHAAALDACTVGPARHPAARRLRRRLDHARGGRPLQRRAGQPGLGGRAGSRVPAA